MGKDSKREPNVAMYLFEDSTSNAEMLEREWQAVGWPLARDGNIDDAPP